MAIITKPTQAEKDMFKHAKPVALKLPGKVLHHLYAEFEIGGGFASNLAGFFLGYKKNTMESMLTRGIRRNDYEYLRLMLTSWRMERMIYEQMNAHQPVRADGKRHRQDDYMDIPDKIRKSAREYMRAQRAVDPQKWRKPKSTKE